MQVSRRQFFKICAGGMAEAFDDVVLDGVRRKRLTLDILEKLLNAEITQRQINQTEARVKRGRFPQQRHFNDFNFAHSMLEQAHLDLLIVGDISLNIYIVTERCFSWYNPLTPPAKQVVLCLRR